MFLTVHRSVFDDAKELVVELHFGEGGEDSKQFVLELFSAYVKYAASLALKTEILDNTSHGHIVAKFSGDNVWNAFKNEIGAHAVQRYPKTERGGRRHTYIVSVAVLPLPPKRDFQPLPESELEVQTTMGSGPGGQHRNKTESAVRMRHKPTSMMVFICTERSQHQNYSEALRILTAKVNERRVQEEAAKYGLNRSKQLGGGHRGDKVRTYNFIRSICIDHVLKKKLLI